MTFDAGRPEHGLRSLTRRSAAWNGVAVTVTESVWSGGEGWHEITASRPSLSIVLEEVGGRYEHRTAPDRPPAAAPAGAHRVSILPAGMPLWGVARELRYARTAQLEFDQPLRDAPCLMVTAAATWQIAALLAEECDNPGQTSQLYVDSLAAALRASVGDGPGARLSRSPAAPALAARGMLAPWQMQRLTDFMQAHLTEIVTLGQLAAQIGLSISHFGRLFRASTGLSPYRWQLDLRLRRARELLLDPRLSLAEIAISTGFADQSHFTRHFARRLGGPPGAWRRARLGAPPLDRAQPASRA